MKKWKEYKKFIILIIITMGSQALFYYVTKLFISDYHVINSVLEVPFIKYAIYIYNSWYPFIALSAFMVYKYDGKEFNTLIITMLLASLLAQLTFIAYPSMVVRPEIVVNDFTDRFVNFTYTGDYPAVNCLPSMHCVYCFITSYYLLKSKKLNYKIKIPFLSYSLLVVVSTLFIKQHVIEDVVLALVYTFVTVLVIYINQDRITDFFNKIKQLHKKKSIQ